MQEPEAMPPVLQVLAASNVHDARVVWAKALGMAPRIAARRTRLNILKEGEVDLVEEGRGREVKEKRLVGEGTAATSKRAEGSGAEVGR